MAANGTLNSSISLIPFKIDIEEARLTQLKDKLASALLPDELEGGENWDSGVSLREINRLVRRWKDEFDWRKQEAKLNELPQFLMEIDVDFDSQHKETLKVHFIHQRSEVANAIPLIFVHGWPGSFLEATKILHHLGRRQSPDLPAFHVVAPSLPNFGFSEGPKRRGYSLSKYAHTCHKLMLNLGYKAYVTQGGDWGYMITRAMGYLYPLHCKASHINMMPVGPPKWSKNPLLALKAAVTPFSSMDKQALANVQQYTATGNGYLIQQSTRPQTLGYALSDSPVGLLAWIYEKLHDWTDNYPWTDDEILTWISIYWFSTAGPAASLRIYYEAFRSPDLPSEVRDGWIPHVKYGVCRLKREVIMAPRSWYLALGNIVHESESEEGGHFAAWERPEFIANDVKQMFRKGAPAFGVVEGKNGY